MAKKIKGIVVELGGDTSGLTKALSDADRALSATQKEINEVQKALKLDPSNAVLLAQKQELLTQAVADTSAKLRALEDNAEKAKRAFEANGEWERQFAPLKEKIDAAKKSLNDLKEKQQEAEKEFAAGKISAEDYEKINDDVAAAKKALSNLNEEKKKLDEQFKDGHITAEEYRAYQREVENTRSRLQGLQTELRDTGVTAEQVHEKLSDFGNRAKETFGQVVKAAAAITAALIVVGKQAVETGSQFDISMSEVAATLGYTWEELTDGSSEAAETMETLRDFALDLGKSTAFSAKEASEGLQYMALAGMDAAESIEMLPKVLDLASASGMELGRSSDMVTDAMSALGLSAEETTIMIDQMAKTASRSNTSVEQLGDAILTIGATGEDVAGGTKELATALGLLADNGIKGSEGGTKLRNIILALEAPTDKAAAALENLGVSAFDANGEFRPLQDTFNDLDSALAGLSEQDAAIAKSSIFSKRDLAAVNALLNTTTQRWNELGDEIEDSTGAAHEMAEVKLDNLAGDVTLFKSALEGAEITISDRLTPSLRNAVQFGTEAVTKLADGFGEAGLSGAVAAAHKLIRDSFEEQADLIFKAEAAVQGLIAAYVTYKTTMLLSEGIAALKMVNSLLAEGKTLTEALNAAQMANPYVLIATVAIGAGAAIKQLIDIETDLIDEVDDAYDKLDERQKQAVDNAQKVAETIGKSREAYDKERESIQKQAEGYKGLAEELYKLDSQQVISNQDRAAMQAIVEKLNGSIEGLNIQLDEETGHLLTQRKAIDDLIDGYERQALAAAAQQRMTDLYTQKIDAIHARREALDEVTAAEEKLNKLLEDQVVTQRALDAAIDDAKMSGIAAEESESVTLWTEKLKESTQAVEDQKDKLGLLRAEYVDMGQAVKDAETDIDETKNLLKEMGDTAEESADKTADGMDKVEQSADKAAEAVSISFEEMQEKVDTAVSGIEDRIKAYEDKLASRTGTLQNWFDINATVSGDDAKFSTLQENLDKQILGMKEWSESIAKLEKEGINENFLDKLKDAGPQSQELLNSILSVSPEQRKEFADKWDKAYQGAADTAKKQLQKMQDDTEAEIRTMLDGLSELSPEFKAAFGDLADFAVDGYIDEIKRRLPELKEWGKEFGKAGEEGYDEETRTESPSKEYAERGKYAVEGWTEGVEDELTEAVKTAKKLADETLKATEQGSNTTTIGRRVNGRLVTDIKTAEQAAVQAAAPAAVAIDYKQLADAVKEGLTELADSTFEAVTQIDSDAIAIKTYRKIDVLIGGTSTLTEGGYAT